MPRYRHVLTAFDGSREAGLALAHAVGMAHVHHAKLAMVAVVAPPARLGWPAADGTRGRHGSEPAELEQRLRIAADSVPDDLPVTTRLLDGDPAHEILRVADEGDFDVIVLGSRGWGRAGAALLGSVSHRVMHEAQVPVIVIHAPPDDGPDLAA